MKAYILQNKDGKFASVNLAVADDGFRKMGWEIVPFSRLDNARLLDLTPEDVVVGFIEDVNAALFQLRIESPAEINHSSIDPGALRLKPNTPYIDIADIQNPPVTPSPRQ